MAAQIWLEATRTFDAHSGEEALNSQEVGFEEIGIDPKPVSGSHTFVFADDLRLCQ
jgi:hypothetical protein